MFIQNAYEVFRLAHHTQAAALNPTDENLKKAAQAAEDFVRRRGIPVPARDAASEPPRKPLHALFALLGKVFSSLADFRLTPEELSDIAVLAIAFAESFKRRPS